MRCDAVQCSAHPTDGARSGLLADFPLTHSFVALRVCPSNCVFSFLTVYGGTSADFSTLASVEDPFPIVASLPTLVPETQLLSLAQAVAPGAMGNPTSPAWRIKPFPAARYSRYVRERAFKFLLLELRPFVDQQSATGQVPLGLSWVEVYGEAAAEDDAAAFNAALSVAAAAGSRSAASMAGMLQADGSDAWAKDPAADLAMRSKKGLEAFQPTGAAERALQAQLARNPPPPPRNVHTDAAMSDVAAAAAAARPILNRNASFMQGLRDNAASPSSSPAAAASKLPPACPRHPAHHSMLQRQDRKTDPLNPRTFFVCTAKDAAGNPCDTKIYQS